MSFSKELREHSNVLLVKLDEPWTFLVKRKDSPSKLRECITESKADETVGQNDGNGGTSTLALELMS